MRRSRRRGPAVLALAVAVAALAGCSWPPGVAPVRVTAVRVVRTSPYPADVIPPFDRTVIDPARAERLYMALLALPRMPAGTYSCPIDFGVVYDLTFFDGVAPALRATALPGGCRQVTVGGDSGRWAIDDAFWQVFAETLGVPEATVYPVVPSTVGPPAPTATP